MIYPQKQRKQNLQKINFIEASGGGFRFVTPPFPCSEKISNCSKVMSTLYWAFNVVNDFILIQGRLKIEHFDNMACVLNRGWEIDDNL